MTCKETLDLLDDYVDGELPESDFQEVELHLASCPRCAEQERLLRSLLAGAAALPREVSPARDLWPGIAGRLGAQGTLRWGRLSWGASFLAAAAAVVVVVWMGGRDEGPRSPSSGTLQPAAAGIDTGLLASEREYARAAAELVAALERSRPDLPPEAMARVEANLRTIDTALAEVRAAVREDPSSPQLNHLLTSTHQKKIDALQRVVRLTRS